MAESITFNNAIYIIPDVGESNWGQNLTNYFVAIPQGCYQLSGGTAPLTADLSFGTNFGLFAKYLTSVTAHPSATGVIRLANTDAVSWRNHANGADLPLSVDTSNNLLWNGDIISTSSTGPVLSITGTSNEITASAATGNVTLSIPSTFIGPGSIAATTTLAGTTVTLSATTNQILLGTTQVITLSSTAPASSQTYTIPDAGSAANVVLDHGAYTIAGTWGFSNSITLASSKAVILTDDSTHTVTLKATNSTTSYTFSLPTTSGTNTYFLQTDGSGNTSWQPGGSGTVQSGAAGNLTLYPATAASVSDTYVQNTHNITIGIAAQASRSAALALTIPNPGNAVTTDTFALLGLAQTFTGQQTLSSTSGNPIHGNASNTAAAAGYVGETIAGPSSAGTNLGGSGSYTNCSSIALTAGTWLISGMIYYANNGATVTAYQCLIGTTSGSATGTTTGVTLVQTAPPPTSSSVMAISPFVASLSGNTTYYLIGYGTYTVATPIIYGNISATRIC